MLATIEKLTSFIAPFCLIPWDRSTVVILGPSLTKMVCQGHSDKSNTQFSVLQPIGNIYFNGHSFPLEILLHLASRTLHSMAFPPIFFDGSSPIYVISLISQTS